THDRLEVLGGTARHLEHVGGGCAKLEGPALVILDVVVNAAHLIDRIASHPGALHEQPGWRRHHLDRSSHCAADCSGHLLCSEELGPRRAVKLSGVARGIPESRGRDACNVLVTEMSVPVSA